MTDSYLEFTDVPSVTNFREYLTSLVHLTFRAMTTMSLKVQPRYYALCFNNIDVMNITFPAFKIVYL